MHAAAARDPISSTQRIRKVKISMVGIYKVKVRLAYLALAHVSHFFLEREPWALKQSTHFSIFERFEILCMPDLPVSLAPPSPSEKNFDAFSTLFTLICSFLPYVQGGSSHRQRGFADPRRSIAHCHTRAASLSLEEHVCRHSGVRNLEMLFVWGPPSHISQTIFVVGFVN